MSNQLIAFARNTLTAPREADPFGDGAGTLVRGGWLVAGAFFVLFLGWAAFVHVDAAATAGGTITVSGNRQTIQHKDGGIVSAINVREGQHVRAGDVLITLSAGDVRANERALAAQTIRLEAERARLLAERTGTPLVAPTDFASLTGDDRKDADQAMALQRSAMASRRAALQDQKRVLAQQSAQLRAQIDGTQSRMGYSQQQDQLFKDELSGMQALANEGYVSKNRVRDLMRERASVGGEGAGLAASAASARAQIGERQMQALTLDSQQAEKISQELRDTEASLDEALPKYLAAKQQLEQTLIRAPVSGQIVGLQIFTVGGVIGAGQKLMDIVPDAAPLVVDAQFTPDDADDVHVGQRAEVRVTALHDRSAPVLMGTVTRVSADSFKDDKTGRSYYTATVSVPANLIAALDAHEGKANALKPGLPVAVLVPLRKRTLLQYLMEPIDQVGWQSLHEH